MDWEDLQGEMPRESLIQALDDNGDGEADEAAWFAVTQSARERVINAFGGEPPEMWKLASDYALKVFCLEILYRRRGYSGDRNPFSQQAAAAEKRLINLAAGVERPDGEASGGDCLTTPTKATPSKGGFMA